MGAVLNQKTAIVAVFWLFELLNGNAEFFANSFAGNAADEIEFRTMNFFGTGNNRGLGKDGRMNGENFLHANAGHNWADGESSASLRAVLARNH